MTKWQWWYRDRPWDEWLFVSEDLVGRLEKRAWQMVPVIMQQLGMLEEAAAQRVIRDRQEEEDVHA